MSTYHLFFTKSHALLALTAGLLHLALTIFVVSRDTRAPINRVYGLWGFALTLWNLSMFFKSQAPDRESAIFWLRFLHMGVVFLPISIFHLCLLIARVSIGRVLVLLYLVYVGLAVSIFTGQYIANVRWLDVAGYYIVPGPTFRIFSFLYTATAVTTISMLYFKQRSLPRLQRTRLRALLLAYLILVAFGTNDLLPILGYDNYPLTTIPFYPMGSIAAILFGIVVCYSVLQHQLLDIHVTLGRMAARLVRLLFFFLVGLVMLLVLMAIAPEQFTLFTFVGSLGAMLLSAVVASFFFPRLLGAGSDSLERRILGDRFEYHDKIRGFTESMPWYSDTDLLLADFHDLLIKIVRVQSYQIILLEETSRVLALFRAHPEQPRSLLPDLHAGSPLFEHFHKTQQDFLALNRDYAMAGETKREAEARRQLKPFNAEICFPFYSGEDLFGFLLVGSKTSGDPFTPYDVHLLTSLINNLSLILNQIRLKRQIWAAQELELMGRMSRGLAHDLNNLVTPISTFLQLAEASSSSNGSGAELLPLAMRNLQTVQAYINESLFFSQNQEPHFQVVRLDELVIKATEILEAKLRRKEITVSTGELPELAAELDQVLILRLISNLLSNAIDASPNGSKIEMELTTVARLEANRDWVRLRVIDHGIGISRENLKRVTTPYFTTKDHGDENRGFGLGLAICRKIVHLHGGHLKIESEEEKGTVVQVDLPSRAEKSLKPVAGVIS